MCRIIWKSMPEVGVIYVKTVDVKEEDARLVSRLRSLWRAQAK